MNIEYEYKREALPKLGEYGWKNKCVWFKEMHDNGWELVCADHTYVTGGHTWDTTNNQYYIFRKKIINSLPKENISI